jgi:glycosyltransferase involved in cell wall biosynthesis
MADLGQKMPNLTACHTQKFCMKRVTQPTISFIVIAYNEEHRIAKTLRSIINQNSNFDFEIVVVSDGSTDSTVQIARQCLAQFSYFKVLNLEKNTGRGSARHLGSSTAAGEILAFIDSDVELPANWLNQTVAAIKNGADAVSGIAVPDGDCVVVGRISKLEPRNRPGSAKLTGNNLLIRREALDAVPFRKIPYGDDIRLAWDLEHRGFWIERLDDLVVRHSESKSYTKTLLWQYQQGRDASHLLTEYRRLRLPDLVWIALMLLFVSSIFFKPNLNLFFFYLLAFTLCLSIISGVFISSRFKIKIHKAKTYLAILVNLPLMTSYFIGRSAGLLEFLRKY